MEELKNHGKKWFYWLSIGTVLIVIYKVLDQLPNVTEAIGVFFKALSPIIAGVFIAYVLYLPCRKFEKKYQKSKIKFIKNKARALSLITVYGLLFIIITVVIQSIAPVIIDSFKELISNLQEYVQITIKKYQELPENSLLKSYELDNLIKNFNGVDDIIQFINMDNIGTYAKNAIGVFTGIFNVFVAFIVSVYVLSERDRIYGFIRRGTRALFKDKNYKNLMKYFNSANKIFLGFISSQLIDAIIVSVLTTIAMSFMGIKYAPLLGLIIGIFNIIPYVGAIIGVAISAIITLITGGLSQAIWMVVIITILQQIDANVINPKIIGNSLKMSPLLVIIAITVGGTYWGVVGMFVSVPISALIKIIAEDYIDYKIKEKIQIKKIDEE